MSVKCWQSIWYWKYTIFWPNCIKQSLKSYSLSPRWTISGAITIFLIDSYIENSISPQLSVKCWQSRCYWKYTIVWLNFIKPSFKSHLLSPRWTISGAKTIFLIDSYIENSISPQLSVKCWQSRCYWKYTIVWLNFIKPSLKSHLLSPRWTISGAKTIFLIDSYIENSISPQLSVKCWQSRWYWKYTIVWLNFIKPSLKSHSLSSRWTISGAITIILINNNILIQYHLNCQ